ncbi:MAG: hypothetical protein RQ743_11145 [Bacteroidales bacterium]|nr:hypothetical protein [Bacteroidales bacterium]
MVDYTQHPLNKKYDLDTALGSIWEFYKKWFGSLILIAFVFSLITSYLTGRINISEIYSLTDPEEMMAIVKSMIGPYSLIILFTFTFTLILQYYVIRKPVDPDASIFSIGTTGILKFFLPLLLLTIILAVFAMFAITLGIFLFIVGALFATVYVVMIYAFIAPVLMIEDSGIGDTITTTLRLSHKRFWPNIGWVAVFIILLMVISLILSTLIMIPYGGSFFRTIMNPGDAGELLNITSKPSFIILSAIINALTMPLFPIFSLVLYFNSRSDSHGELTGNRTKEYEGGPVKIEDLYSDTTNKSKKGLDKKDEVSPPSIEDLIP